MKIYTTYESIDLAAWQDLINRAENATWFQTAEAYCFLRKTRDYMPFVVAVGEADRLMGVCCGQISRASNPITQFFTRRAIINGGPAYDAAISHKALYALLRAVSKQTSEQAIYTEIRCFHDYGPRLETFRTAGWTYSRHLNFHIECMSRDSMWQNLSENRKRQIQKAESLGVLTEKTQSEADLRSWYDILHKLYIRHVHKPLPSIDFFRHIMQSEVLLVVREPEHGRVIGGIACVQLPGRALYEWYICGQDEQYKSYAPSVMATWAAMTYAEQQGLPLFDVMGAGVPQKPYGVRDFKQKFGGRLVEHGRLLFVAHPWLYKFGKAVYRMILRKKA